MKIHCETGETIELPDDPAILVSDVDLHRAILVRRDLRRRRFVRCSFRNALLGLSQLDGVEFVDCTLVLAEFDGASLDAARFIGGHANGASFHSVNLTGGLFTDIDLSGATFTGANLDAARFEADPSAARLADALYTAATQWPTGFEPHGRRMRKLAEPEA